MASREKKHSSLKTNINTTTNEEINTKQNIDNSEKVKNPFLVPSKKHDKSEKAPRLEINNLNKDEHRLPNKFFSNNKNDKEKGKDLKLDGQPNMFQKSLNKTQIFVNNEEMFPSLKTNFLIEPHSSVYKKNKNKNATHKSFAETIMVGIDSNIPKEENKKLCALHVSRTPEIKYSGENDYEQVLDVNYIKNSKKHFDEWNKNRIERIKLSFEYDYLWDEDKRNEMIYGFYKDDLDVYEDNNDSNNDEIDEDYDDMFCYKKKYNDDIN